MKRNRLVYAALVIGTGLLYIVYTNHFSWMLFRLVLVYAPLQFIISLPFMLGASIEMGVRPDETIAGGEFTIKVTSAARLPICKLRITLRCTNLFSGDEEKWSLIQRPGETYEATITQAGAVCGAVECVMKRPRIMDVSGIFALPLSDSDEVIVLQRPPMPAEDPGLPLTALLQPGATDLDDDSSSPDAMREFTDIREYRDGDPMRDVHWKLSAKFDKLIIRETTFFVQNLPRLCFDRYGDPARVSIALGRVEALSRAMLDLERTHTIHWLDMGRIAREFTVSSRADFDQFLWTMLQVPLPQLGTPVAEIIPSLRGTALLVRADRYILYNNGKSQEVYL